MSVTELMAQVTALFQALGFNTYVAAFVIISIAVALLSKLFDRG